MLLSSTAAEKTIVDQTLYCKFVFGFSISKSDDDYNDDDHHDDDDEKLNSPFLGEKMERNRNKCVPCPDYQYQTKSNRGHFCLNCRTCDEGMRKIHISCFSPVFSWVVSNV